MASAAAKSASSSSPAAGTPTSKAKAAPAKACEQATAALARDTKKGKPKGKGKNSRRGGRGSSSSRLPAARTPRPRRRSGWSSAQTSSSPGTPRTSFLELLGNPHYLIFPSVFFPCFFLSPFFFSVLEDVVQVLPGGKLVAEGARKGPGQRWQALAQPAGPALRPPSSASTSGWGPGPLRDLPLLLLHLLLPPIQLLLREHHLLLWGFALLRTFERGRWAAFVCEAPMLPLGNVGTLSRTLDTSCAALGFDLERGFFCVELWGRLLSTM